MNAGARWLCWVMLVQTFSRQPGLTEGLPLLTKRSKRGTTNCIQEDKRNMKVVNMVQFKLKELQFQFSSIGYSSAIKQRLQFQPNLDDLNRIWSNDSILSDNEINSMFETLWRYRAHTIWLCNNTSEEWLTVFNKTETRLLIKDVPNLLHDLEARFTVMNQTLGQQLNENILVSQGVHIALFNVIFTSWESSLTDLINLTEQIKLFFQSQQCNKGGA
ncbi:uncharacterized protein LOC114658618 isoform X1 [Erpetoichthys calabaricus]|uniref:uncharacterized protein LOC114658618 isoform X1 n=2 Tax=Erpetoichthys calabaricus TaxID=27687 RepID=UPI0022345A8F|nr:uncharacterized protein LOC114658618 isoform X1 [Erpetoichthys calabaricus]